MTWLEIAKALAGLAVIEIRKRIAKAKAVEAVVRGPALTQVDCIECGAKVPADAASMSSHRAAHRNRN